MATPLDELITQGHTLNELGHLDEAAQAFAQALELDHQHIEASLGLARIAMSLSMVEQSIAILDRTLGFAPENPDALALRGLVEEGRGHLEAALDYLRKAAKSGSRSYFARYHYGRALTVARSYKEAIHELQAAAKLSQNAVAPHYALGVAYKESGKLGEAVTEFTRTLEIDPTFLDGYMTLADVLSEAKRQETAEKVLLQAQSLFPDAGVVYDKLAAIYFKQGNLPKTVQTLEEQVRVEPTNEAAYLNLAIFALAASDAGVAASAVNQLLKLNPRSWKALHLRSSLYDMGDRVDLAMKDLREAARLAPQEWKPKNDLGSLLNAQVQKARDPATAAEAVAILESACSLAPQAELAPRFNLAIAYWNAGRPADAKRMALQVAQTAGQESHPVALQAKEMLAALEQVQAAGR